MKHEPVDGVAVRWWGFEPGRPGSHPAARWWVRGPGLLWEGEVLVHRAARGKAQPSAALFGLAIC